MGVEGAAVGGAGEGGAGGKEEDEGVEVGGVVGRAAAHAGEEGEALVEGAAGGVGLEDFVVEESGGGSGVGVEKGAGVGYVGDLEELRNEELGVVDAMPEGVGVDLLDLEHNSLLLRS